MELNLREADIAAIFDKGLQAHNAGDLSAAEQLYQETLVIKPEHPEANHNIGVVLVAKNELDKALEFFKFALDNSPNVSLFWASYIDTLIKLERIGESKTLIKAVKKAGISCDKIEAISLQLDVLYQEPDAKASQKCDELIEQQKFDDAIKACLSLTKAYPNSAVLNINLGKCYFELGQIEQAISSYKKATEYQPKWEIGFALLGFATLCGCAIPGMRCLTVHDRRWLDTPPTSVRWGSSASSLLLANICPLSPFFFFPCVASTLGAP